MEDSDDQLPLTDEEEATETVAARDCADQKALENVTSQSLGLWAVLTFYAGPVVFVFTPLAWVLVGKEPGLTGLWIQFLIMLFLFVQAKEVHLHYRVLGPLAQVRQFES